MTILGIDPGLAHTGWGIIRIQGKGIRCLEYGTVTTKAGQKMGERLLAIHDQLEQVIKRFNPVIAGVETLYFNKNHKSAIPVAEARGVILLTMYQNNVLLHELTPLMIKQGITGAGRAGKEQVQEMVRKILGLKEVPRPDHSADALAAAICCYYQQVSRQRMGGATAYV